jgi:hypothetical protein
MIVDNLYSEDPTPPSVGANQTQRNSEVIAADTALMQSTQSGADGGVMSWTGAAPAWYLGAVAFKEAAAGGGSTSNAKLVKTFVA